MESLFLPFIFLIPEKEERLGGASFKNLKEMPPSKRGAQTGRAEIPRPLFNRHRPAPPPPDAPGNTSSPNLTYIFHRFARLDRLSSAPAPLSRTFSAVTIPYGDRGASRQKLSSKNDEKLSSSISAGTRSTTAKSRRISSRRGRNGCFVSLPPSRQC